MKKILSSQQMRCVDAFTIKNEPISSLDLMERASKAVVDRILTLFPTPHRVIVFAGPGNNGGDALAVARLLSLQGFKVHVYLFNISNKLSEDCSANKSRLKYSPTLVFHEIVSDFVPPLIEKDDIVIDGLFGTGLTRPLAGGFAAVVKYINSSEATVISIDVPSGLMTEDNSTNAMNHIVHATYTLTFQYCKLAFMFADNYQYVGKLEVLNISLQDPLTDETDTPYYIFDKADAAKMLKERPKFSHKGTFGHACLIAGKKGMVGAAILASKACMRSGVGKLTVHTPEANVIPLQISIPEAILDIEPQTEKFSRNVDTSGYDAVAVGPGLGADDTTMKALAMLLHYHQGPLVIDADALNIIGSHRDLLRQIPADSILTPHKKELRGLIGPTANCYEELQMTRNLAQKHNIYIIIKGANSAIVTPDGKVIFNPSGNPGMSTAGSGDVLTGMILSCLAQDYSSMEAALLGTYLHGLAGDLASEELCQESLMASDIINSIPKAFREIHNGTI